MSVMPNQTEQHSKQTFQDTPFEVPLHRKISADALQLFLKENHGIRGQIGRLHPRNGEPTSGAYVKQIAKGERPLHTERARAISKTLDRYIRAWAAKRGITEEALHGYTANRESAA